ncbi:MAG: hypothetical protein MHM6MM_000511 [Cercozoa sp. M6MM]
MSDSRERAPHRRSPERDRWLRDERPEGERDSQSWMRDRPSRESFYEPRQRRSFRGARRQRRRSPSPKSVRSWVPTRLRQSQSHGQSQGQSQGEPPATPVSTQGNRDHYVRAELFPRGPYDQRPIRRGWDDSYDERDHWSRELHAPSLETQTETQTVQEQSVSEAAPAESERPPPPSQVPPSQVPPSQVPPSQVPPSQVPPSKPCPSLPKHSLPETALPETALPEMALPKTAPPEIAPAASALKGRFSERPPAATPVAKRRLVTPIALSAAAAAVARRRLASSRRLQELPTLRQSSVPVSTASTLKRQVSSPAAVSAPSFPGFENIVAGDARGSVYLRSRTEAWRSGAEVGAGDGLFACAEVRFSTSDGATIDLSSETVVARLKACAAPLQMTVRQQCRATVADTDDGDSVALVGRILPVRCVNAHVHEAQQQALSQLWQAAAKTDMVKDETDLEEDGQETVSAGDTETVRESRVTLETVSRKARDWQRHQHVLRLVSRGLSVAAARRSALCSFRTAAELACLRRRLRRRRMRARVRVAREHVQRALDSQQQHPRSETVRRQWRDVNVRACCALLALGTRHEASVLRVVQRRLRAHKFMRSARLPRGLTGDHLTGDRLTGDSAGDGAGGLKRLGDYLDRMWPRDHSHVLNRLFLLCLLAQRRPKSHRATWLQWTRRNARRLYRQWWRYRRYQQHEASATADTAAAAAAAADAADVDRMVDDGDGDGDDHVRLMTQVDTVHADAMRRLCTSVRQSLSEPSMSPRMLRIELLNARAMQLLEKLAETGALFPGVSTQTSVRVLGHVTHRQSLAIAPSVTTTTQSNGFFTESVDLDKFASEKRKEERNFGVFDSLVPRQAPGKEEVPRALREAVRLQGGRPRFSLERVSLEQALPPFFYPEADDKTLWTAQEALNKCIAETEAEMLRFSRQELLALARLDAQLDSHVSLKRRERDEHARHVEALDAEIDRLVRHLRRGGVPAESLPPPELARRVQQEAALLGLPSASVRTQTDESESLAAAGDVAADPQSAAVLTRAAASLRAILRDLAQVPDDEDHAATDIVPALLANTDAVGADTDTASMDIDTDRDTDGDTDWDADTVTASVTPISRQLAQLEVRTSLAQARLCDASVALDQLSADDLALAIESGVCLAESESAPCPVPADVDTDTLVQQLAYKFDSSLLVNDVDSKLAKSLRQLDQESEQMLRSLAHAYVRIPETPMTELETGSATPGVEDDPKLQEFLLDLSQQGLDCLSLHAVPVESLPPDVFVSLEELDAREEAAADVQVAPSQSPVQFEAQSSLPTQPDTEVYRRRASRFSGGPPRP